MKRTCGSFPSKPRRPGIAVALVCASLSGLATRAAAADEAPPVLKTTLTSVSLFKNGLGFMTRSAELPRGNGPWLIESLPAPVNGTFWVTSPSRDTTVTGITAFVKERVERVDAIHVSELLEANVGEDVELRISEKETIRGKILRVAAARPAEPLPRDNSPSPYSSYRVPVEPGPEPATLVILQTPNGTVAVNRNSVQEIAIQGAPLKTSIDRKTRGPALLVTTSAADGKGELAVQYLSRGITWVPSCAIDITDPQKARVSVKATIIDEIEDLDRVPVSFVSGFPNLRYGDVTDPIALRDDLAAFIQAMTASAQGGRTRDVTMQQRALSNVATYDTVSNIDPLGVSGQGEMREELYFYEPRTVTLKKGERGVYPLLSLDVPYEHVYEWKIGDTLDEQERYAYQGRRDDDDDEKPEDVWHSVRLTNTGGAPWTTAPAMTVQGGRILGQDLVHYTSAGARTTVRITKALDVKAERTEAEVERERNAASFYGSTYDLVTVRGTLKATNYKDKRITLTIAKELSGEVVRTDEAKVEQTARGLRKVNPRAQLTWERPIDPRGSIEVVYTYKVYVRG